MMNNVVFIVKEVPSTPRDCPFAKWYSYPPVVEEYGYYECVLGGKCKIANRACKHMEPIWSECV